MRRQWIPSLALFVAGQLVLTACAGDAPTALSDRPAKDTAAETTSQVPAGLEQFNKNLPKAGQGLPMLMGKTIAGTSVDNTSFAGKTALINLWFHG